MGTVKAYRKTHWVIALDADLASIPNPQLGDTALTEDKKKLYYWEGGAWKTGLGYETVPTEKAAEDWTEANFTLDGTLKANGLDLTGKVPVGTKIVGFVMQITHASAGEQFMLSANETTKLYNRFGLTTHAANIPSGWIYGRVYIDADRLLDYLGDAGLDISLIVVDWDI